MKFTDEEYSLIQDYLNDNLTEGNRLRFEENMKNEEFKLEVVTQLSVLGALQDEANASLKEKILTFETEVEKAKETVKPITKTKVIGIGKYLKYAAVLVLLIAAVMVFQWSSNTTLSSDEIYAQAYQTYPATEIKRGKEDEAYTVLKSAMDLYRNGKYTAALTEFEALNMNDPNVNLYIGVCAMETSQFDKAKTYFDQVKESNATDVKQVAEWYSVLVHYKLQETEEFSQGLDEILNNKAHLFYAKAKDLKSTL
ncbi:MAG: tetratricopeptide repeat protein [Saprospiraceae bacterium]|nr:tetratricopeptide repeat protein [Saprospiraceae bacterium]